MDMDDVEAKIEELEDKIASLENLVERLSDELSDDMGARVTRLEDGADDLENDLGNRITKLEDDVEDLKASDELSHDHIVKFQTGKGPGEV